MYQWESQEHKLMGVAWVCVAYVLEWEPISRSVFECGSVQVVCGYVLDCTPQAYKACRCPASGPKKKESGKSHRDINDLVQNKGSWNNTPQCAADGRQDMVAILAPRGRTMLPFIGRN